jgi:hypothetical protein
LLFAVWDSKEIWGFFCGLIITSLRICNLETGKPQQICGLSIAVCLPTFAYYGLTNVFGA